MFKLSSKDQSAKAGALQDLLDMMSDTHGDALKGMSDAKKPAAMAIDVTAMKPGAAEGSPDEEATELPGDEAAEDGGHGGLSPEEQMMLDRLLKKAGGR